MYRVALALLLIPNPMTGAMLTDGDTVAVMARSVTRNHEPDIRFALQGEQHKRYGRPDTTVILGRKTVDLTNDGRVEVIELVASGRSLDSLRLTLTITSEGDTIFAHELAPITNRRGFDADTGTRADAEQKSHIDGLGGIYLHDRNFRAVVDFIAAWEAMAPAHVHRIADVIAGQLPDTVGRTLETAKTVWSEIRSRNGIVFEYASGGDGLTAIAWSGSHKRFYHLVDCC